MTEETFRRIARSLALYQPPWMRPDEYHATNDAAFVTLFDTAAGKLGIGVRELDLYDLWETNKHVLKLDILDDSLEILDTFVPEAPEAERSLREIFEHAKESACKVSEKISKILKALESTELDLKTRN